MIIDTTNKTVNPQNEKLGNIVAVLQEMFPKGEWKEYTIAPTVQTVEIRKEHPIFPYWDQQNPLRVIGDPTQPSTGTPPVSVPYITCHAAPYQGVKTNDREFKIGGL